MKIYLLFIVLFLPATYCKAQQLTVDILQQGNSYTDSSYYDIIKVNNKFWICGKYGILKEIDEKGNIENIHYPSKSLDIYKLENINEEKIIASGDKGTIYIHDLITKTWEVIEVKGYENSCFYNLAVDEQNKIFVVGGNSRIAHSGKSMPNGFILTSLDFGKTWKKEFHNFLNMVWCVKKNPFTGKMYALMYSPNKTYLFGNEDGKWVKKQKIGNSIFHEIQFTDKTNFVATGGWIGKNGRIYSTTTKKVIENSGLLWSRVKNENYTIFTGCNGNIVLENKNGKIELFETTLNKAFSIYEAIFISSNTAYAIGSGRTILKLNIEEKNIFEAKSIN